MKGISWSTVVVTIILFVVLQRVAPQIFAGHGPKAHYPVGPVSG